MIHGQKSPCPRTLYALNTEKAYNLRRANRCALGVHRAIYKHICPIVHFKRLGSRHIHKEIEIS